MVDIIKSLKWRYAVKKFDSERRLSLEQIQRIKETFNLTATSYGLQPINLLIVQNKDIRERLLPHSYGQQQVLQASHVLVICIHKKVDAQYISRYFNRVGKIRGTSNEVLDPFKEELIRNFSKKDEREIQEWGKNQAYLAMGNLLTVCAIEEIDSCPMEGFDSQAYDRVLELEKRNLTSVLVLPIGHRAKDDMFSSFKKVRKELEETIIEII